VSYLLDKWELLGPPPLPPGLLNWSGVVDELIQRGRVEGARRVAEQAARAGQSVAEEQRAAPELADRDPQGARWGTASSGRHTRARRPDRAAMIALEFVTSLDAGAFPHAVATVNSILHFHPEARVTVVGGAAKPPTAAERRVLGASDRVRLVDGGSSPGTPMIRGRDPKARACREHGADSAVIVWIDPGAALCSALDDVADPVLLLTTPAALAAWSESPGEPALEPLDPALWFPREAHWTTIIDFQPPGFSTPRRRGGSSGCSTAAWSIPSPAGPITTG
jgi:hypothetical protein